MRNSTIIILIIHLLLYLSVFFDIPIVRQVIVFFYLTFIPGFVIFRALVRKNINFAIEIFLSVGISVAFVMLVGLIAGLAYPYIGISAPITTLPILITTSVLVLTIFALSIHSRFESVDNLDETLNNFSQILHFKKSIGLVLSLLSIFFLVVSISGAIINNTLLLLFSIVGIAATFFVIFFSRNRISSNCIVFLLFIISLTLVFQMALVSQHLMGWDIFAEYYAFESVLRTGNWIPSGMVSTFTATSQLNSILSVTILPTIYSTTMNLNPELIYKTVFPFILCFIPVILFKTFETQFGKTIAFISVLFFIVEPMNLYGVEPLSIVREMITYLFLVLIMFCFVTKDFNVRIRKVLIIVFSTGLAVSHYSLAFLFAFLIIFVYIAITIRRKKDEVLSLPLVLCIVSIIFAWYMYVSSAPLVKLSWVFQNIWTNLTADLFTSSNRLDAGMAALSPTIQTTLNGYLHKILVYISELFVVIGVVIFVIKPKDHQCNRVFRWMVLFAAFLLLVCLVVPNVAPSLNFSRFYRYAMTFLAPMFVFGGLFFFKQLNKVLHRVKLKRSFHHSCLGLFLLIILVIALLLFRSGFISSSISDRPYSYSLDLNRMKTSLIPEIKISLYNMYISEQDVSGAAWLNTHIKNLSTVYTDYGLGLGTFILMDYTSLNITIMHLVNETQVLHNSYVYLRSLNVLCAIIGYETGSFSVSNVNPVQSETDQIYSNGANNVYFCP